MCRVGRSPAPTAKSQLFFRAVANYILCGCNMASIHGYNHVVIVNAPAKAFFEQIDFGYNRKLDGPATAIGTKRTIPIGKKRVIEEQIAREFSSSKMSFSYAIVNEDNAFGVKGYRANVCVLPLTEEPNKCICIWSAAWDSATAAINPLPQLIRKSIAVGEKNALKSSL